MSAGPETNAVQAFGNIKYTSNTSTNDGCSRAFGEKDAGEDRYECEPCAET
jgi:hypothetical protein